MVTTWNVAIRINIYDSDVVEWLLYEGADLPEDYQVTDADRRAFIEDRLNQEECEYETPYIAD
ncbi:MAG: hypothetical protein ACI4PO_09250 [Faecousia sp.]